MKFAVRFFRGFAETCISTGIVECGKYGTNRNCDDDNAKYVYLFHDDVFAPPMAGT